METMTSPYRICVVCSGNICRSPMGEVILRVMLEEEGLADRVVVDSAGTGDWHVGDPADPRTITALGRMAYDGTAHRAGHLTATDVQARDLILVADRGHLRDVEQLVTRAESAAQVQLLREFDPAAVAAGTLEVADPYYGDAADFDRCLVEVEAACAGVVDAVRTRI